MAETTQAVQAKPKRGMSKSLRDSLVAYSFIAPNFIGFCIFIRWFTPSARCR